MKKKLRLPLLGALLLALAGALAVALVPAAMALDERVTRELRRTAVEDLGRGPMILEDRNAARAEALSMHAMSVATSEGLMDAVRRGALDEAVALAGATTGMYGEDPVLVSSEGEVVVGPALDGEALEALRRGESLVHYVYHDDMPRAVGLVALDGEEGWLGAVGSASPLGESLATTLAALTRADVAILSPDGEVVATTLEPELASTLGARLRAGAGRRESEKVVLLPVDGEEYWVARDSLARAGTVLMVRSVAEELAALPAVRRSALVAGGLTLVLALLAGALFAGALSRPVRGLALAADRVAAGDFEAPLPTSRIEEVDRLGAAFRAMRESLRTRLGELAEANEELAEGQRRLRELQSELIRQDRLSSSARMVAEMAHEIRNPVANVRNCLEVVRRGLEDGSEAARFADMAIDELLRMHELSEQLLDLNRPGDPSSRECVPSRVAEEVAALAGVGDEAVEVEVVRQAGADAPAGMAPDALKQVLFNLVENAREAAGTEQAVEIAVGGDDQVAWVEVRDRGPGIPEDELPNVFDPFFTTKGAVTGVGLGLFVAEGLVRRVGGRMEVANRAGGGARFRVELPRADAAPAEGEVGHG